MTLHIEELTYGVERFNSIISFDSEASEYRVEILLSDKNLDPAQVWEDIKANYVDVFTIDADPKVYTFNNYKLESISTNVDSRMETISLRFSK